VLSHQTALALHQLSDVLPSRLHVTLPVAWRHRRFRVPDDVVIHHGDVLPKQKTWIGPVPVTSPARTLNDCANEKLSPELLRDGAQQALTRGMVSREEISVVEAALAPFGGVAPRTSDRSATAARRRHPRPTR
jgi:predicted transcriptional regulator of viral defense system